MALVHFVLVRCAGVRAVGAVVPIGFGMRNAMHARSKLPQAMPLHDVKVALEKRQCQVLWVGGAPRCELLQLRGARACALSLHCRTFQKHLLLCDLRGAFWMFRNKKGDDLEQILRSQVPDALHVEVLAFSSETQREKYPEGSKVRPSSIQKRPHEYSTA
jgi:hypothetical protein